MEVEPRRQMWPHKRHDFSLESAEIAVNGAFQGHLQPPHRSAVDEPIGAPKCG